MSSVRKGSPVRTGDAEHCAPHILTVAKHMHARVLKIYIRQMSCRICTRARDMCDIMDEMI